MVIDLSPARRCDPLRRSYGQSGGFSFFGAVLLNFRQKPGRKGGEIMEDLWFQVGNVGFPMAVAIYLLVRVEKKLDDLTVAINSLGETLRRHWD